ncbi:tripartite tricarboxylate transporter substrate binding protein [Verticiella sediminum]
MPFAAGGTTDGIARMYGESIARELNGSVVVENKPGAAARIGAQFVARSPADGYTLLLAGSSIFSINQFLFKEPGYSVADLTPIGLLSRLPYVLTVANRVPVKDPKEFAQWAAAQAEPVTYGHIGAGSANHLLGVLVAQTLKIRMTGVPYKGNVPANMDLIQGLLDSQLDALNGSLPYHKAGRVRIVGLLEQERWPGLDVPTFAESGYPDLVGGSWLALAAPTGTPAEIVDRLSEIVMQAAEEKRIQDALFETGQVAMKMTQAETQAFIKSEADRWGGLIRSANLTIQES